MTTASGRSDSTLLATRPAMPLTVAGASGAWLRSLRTTEAFASWRSSAKSESLAGAMCTRALATSLSVAMVRASSPSRPRR